MHYEATPVIGLLELKLLTINSQKYCQKLKFVSFGGIFLGIRIFLKNLECIGLLHHPFKYVHSCGCFMFYESALALANTT